MRILVRLVAAMILVLALVAVWMQRTQSFDPPPRLPPHFRSPIVAMELVRTADDIRSVLRDPIGWRNRRVMRRQIAEDWPFIAAYWLLFLGLAGILVRSRSPLARPLAALAVLTATSAALCDVFEDLGILLVLDSDVECVNDAMARSIRIPSLCKWGLLAAAELLTSTLFLSYRRGPLVPGIPTFLAGAAMQIAGILGLAGLAWNPAIEWSSLAFALGLLAALPVLLFAPRAFLQGVGVTDAR